jgi:hypothetical protein
VIEGVLETTPTSAATSLEAVMHADTVSRNKASERILVGQAA